MSEEYADSNRSGWYKEFIKNNPKKDPKNSYDPNTGRWSHEKQQPIRKNVMSTNSNYSDAIGPTKPYDFDKLFPKFNEQTLGNLLTNQNRELSSVDGLSAFRNAHLPKEDDETYADQSLGDAGNLFKNFKFGNNMATYQLGKGVLDTGANLFDVFNNFRNYGLRKDQFDFTKELGNKQYADAREIQDIKFDKMDFNRKERNNFKLAYGGPDGNYLQEAPVSRRT